MHVPSPSPLPLARWLLSKHNGKGALGTPTWLPLGTLAANTAGCAIDFSLQV